MINSPDGPKDSSLACRCDGMNDVPPHAPPIQRLTSAPLVPEKVAAFGDKVLKEIVKVE